MTDAAIVVESLTKRFGKVEALKGVDLQVPPSTVLGLLGPNGAGKTTAVRILTTLLSPDEGHATVAGYDVVKQAEELRHVIGLAGQNAAVDENLTGLENLEMVGRLYHVPAAEAKRRGEEILERFEDRPGSAGAAGDVGRHPRARQGGHHAAAHDPVPR
jgi:ABC-type multidrug transport system ATPase subunit